MAQADRLPERDHHWVVRTPTRSVRHDDIKLLPSGVLEARNQAFETVDDGRTPYRRVVMRTSNFYAPGYWLHVERQNYDKRGNGVS